MFKFLVQLYSMVICLITALILMFILIQILQNLAGLTLTEYKYKAGLAKYNSVNDFTLSNTPEKMANLKALYNVDIEKIILLEKKRDIQEKRDRAISRLIDYTTWLIVSVIFFISHWLIYRKSSREV